MANENDIRRYTRTELRVLRAQGGGGSDLDRVRGMSEAELERGIAEDPDFRDVPAEWHGGAVAAMPGPKKLLSLRLDAEVIEWFKQQGPGYQTRMNAVLRAFVAHSGKMAKAGRGPG